MTASRRALAAAAPLSLLLLAGCSSGAAPDRVPLADDSSTAPTSASTSAPEPSTSQPAGALPGLALGSGWVVGDSGALRWTVDGRPATTLVFTAPAGASKSALCTSLVDGLRAWASTSGHTTAPPAGVSVVDPLDKVTADPADVIAECDGSAFGDELGGMFGPVEGVTVLPTGMKVAVSTDRAADVRTNCDLGPSGSSCDHGAAQLGVDPQDYVTVFAY